jgi:glycosyltransferase involved in cell wall biosynthesis
MRILIVTQYFYPENFKINDFCLELIKRGHELTILTGKPNYPSGKFYKGYSFFSNHKEFFNGAKVIRVPIIPRGEGSSFELILNYFSFAFFGSLFTMFHRKKYDFSFAFVLSPITSAIPAIISRIFHNNKVFLWVLDLWPESVDVTGKMKSSFLRKIVVLLVKFIYRNSDKIFISSKFMKKSIIDKLGPKYPKKILYLPNWAEDTFLYDNINTNKFKHLMPDGFRVMFAGNISYGQDFPSIVKAALILKKTSNVKFIILGDGSEKKYLLNRIKDLNLEDTVFYLGSFPIEEMVNFYCHADMMLLSLRDEIIYSFTVPGKLQGYLASKKVIAGMINGEAAQIINKSECGFTVKAGDHNALAAELLSVSNEPNSFFEKASIKGFNYYQKNFKKETIIDFFLNSIKN